MKLLIGLGCILLIGFCQAHMILNAYKIPPEDNKTEEDLLVKKIRCVLDLFEFSKKN